MRSSALLFCLNCLVLPAVGCFSDTEADTNDCAEGTAACACYGNGTCDDGLRCEASVSLCIPDACVAGDVLGEDGCPCGTSGCAPGLVCSANNLCGAEVETGGSGTTTPTGTTSSTTLSTTESMMTTTTSATDDPSAGQTDGPTSTGSSSTGAEIDQVLLYLSRGPGERSAELFQPGESTRTVTARIAADGICERSAEDLDGCNASTAVFLTDPKETVAGLPVPGDVEIMGTDGKTTVALDWQTLVEEGPAGSLESLGVRPSNDADSFTESYWTGSTASGSYDGPMSCEDWSSEALMVGAGGSLLDASAWLRTAGASPVCTTPTNLLCACWLDPATD